MRESFYYLRYRALVATGKRPCGQRPTRLGMMFWDTPYPDPRDRPIEVPDGTTVGQVVCEACGKTNPVVAGSAALRACPKCHNPLPKP